MLCSLVCRPRLTLIEGLVAGGVRDGEVRTADEVLAKGGGAGLAGGSRGDAGSSEKGNEDLGEHVDGCCGGKNDHRSIRMLKRVKV